MSMCLNWQNSVQLYRRLRPVPLNVILHSGTPRSLCAGTISQLWAGWGRRAKTHPQKRS